MATLAAILDEMAAQIDSTLAGAAFAVQVEPRIVVNPTPPCVDMYPGDPSMDQELAAFSDLVGGEQITVRARVSTADNEAGQDFLLALMDDEDPLSILLALNDDRTLNGLASDVDVRGRSGYLSFPDAGGAGLLLGCTWDVVVIKAKS